MSSSPGTGAGSSRFALPIALLIIGLAFIGSLDNGFVNWDDGPYIVHNPLVLDAAGASLRDRLLTPELGYAAPLPILIYGWAWSPGDSATVLHATSLAVHLFNAALLFWLVRSAGCSAAVSAGAAVAFGVHPIVVESVAWATGLKDLLAASGALLALLGASRGLRALPGALVAFASKPTTVLLALPLAGKWFVTREDEPESRRRALIATIVVAVLGAALLVFTVGQETAAARTSVDSAFSLERVVVALGVQLVHVVVPSSLGPRYDPSFTGALELGVGVLGSIGALVLVVRFARARDPRLPWLLLAIAAYAPVANLRPLARFTADSYFYLPWLGLVGCLALTWPVLQRAFRPANFLAGVLLVGWAGATFVQVESWQDSRALWADSFERHPEDPETIVRYGDALARAGELDEALAIFLAHEAQIRDADLVPVQVPEYYAAAGRPADALDWYRRAFASARAQAPEMYWSYAELVAREPASHDPALDGALRHALSAFPASRSSALGRTERQVLSAHARRLGLGAL